MGSGKMTPLRKRLFFANSRSTRCRIEKKEENREGTQTRKHPNGYPQLEVFEKAAFEKREVRRNCNRYCVLSSWQTPFRRGAS